MSKQNIILALPGDEHFHYFSECLEQVYPVDSLRFRTKEGMNEEFLNTCIIVLSDELPVARLALYRNPFLIHKDKPAFCIGNYECIDDPGIARQLLDRAFLEAKKSGAVQLIGPMNGSTWDSYRFCTGYDQPLFFTESFHPLYYNDHFIAAGFVPMANYFSAIDRKLTHDDPLVIKRGKELRDLGITLRNIDLKDYGNELMRFYPFVTNAFSRNHLYTPITEEYFIQKYLDAEKIIDPEFVLIAEDGSKNIVSLFFCINDLYNKKEKSLVVKTIARDPSPQWKGLGHVVGNEIVKRCSENGYHSLIHAFLFDHGTSTPISKNFSGDIFRNYALYLKEFA